MGYPALFRHDISVSQVSKSKLRPEQLALPASLVNQYAKVNIPDSLSDALMNAQLLPSQTLAHLQGDMQPG